MIIVVSRLATGASNTSGVCGIFRDDDRGKSRQAGKIQPGGWCKLPRLGLPVVHTLTFRGTLYPTPFRTGKRAIMWRSGWTDLRTVGRSGAMSFWSVYPLAKMGHC